MVSVTTSHVSPPAGVPAGAMSEFWTTEQVAAHLGIGVEDVYRTRRNGEWPGSVGRNRGRRLLFRSDLIEAGPQEPATTNDPLEAILWTLQGIEEKLDAMIKLMTPLFTPQGYIYRPEWASDTAGPFAYTHYDSGDEEE